MRTFALCLLLGCSTAAADALTIRYQSNNGSVPPPYRQSSTLTIHADGTAEWVWVRGYDEQAEGARRAVAFSLSRADLDTLVRDLDALQACTTRWQEQDPPPVGGASESLSIQRNGDRCRVPAFPVAAQYERAQQIFRRISAVQVPAQ